MYPRVNPDALPAPGHLEMGHAVPYPAPLPPEQVLPVTVTQHRHGGRAPDTSSCEDHDPRALLVAATLITMLAFLLGTSVPGGYWPQDTPSLGDGTGNGRMYRAGDPIMRDLHRPRYWVFRAASWFAVASSMVLTLSLLVRMPVASRHVRWSFAVAYASLLLTFAASQTRTHLSLDVILCLAVLAVSWLITSVRGENRARVVRVLCCSGRDN